MIAKDELTQIKKQVDEYIGSMVIIKANKGRKRIVTKKGILQNTYPSIFVVKVQNEQQDSFRNISYSYTDLLTNNVELLLYDEM